MGDAVCSRSPESTRRSQRKRKPTTERDKDIFEFFDTDTESETGLYSDSGSEFSSKEVDEEGDGSGDDSNGSLASGFAASTAPESCGSVWREVNENFIRNIRFSSRAVHNRHPSYPSELDRLEPAQVYSTFVDGDLLSMIVAETNRNARHYVDTEDIGPRARMKNWKDTDVREMERFFAIIMYMGIVTYPSIAEYWSTNGLYSNETVSSTMSRNRFQLLLRFVHFSNNQEEGSTERFHKFVRVLDALQDKFCDACKPGERIVVDESMIPFRGRLSFLQYLPGRSSKYGNKMFKLCDCDGYTFRLKVYTGKSAALSRSLPTEIALDLAEPYLDVGRTLVTDNWYTSVPLAKELLERNTHLVGTLRKTRRNLPQVVVKTNLGRGELIGRMSSDGILVGKWKDKRDVLFLSTKHDLRTAPAGRFRRCGTQKIKPVAIIEYNTTKQGVDISDQLASYYSPLRKSIRWYHKVVFELLLNTAVVNARILFNKLTKKNISMKNFREAIIEDFLQADTPPPSPMATGPRRKVRHIFCETEEKDERNRKLRRKCQDCYARLVSLHGRRRAQSSVKRVKTRCEECEKWLCMPCFAKSH